MLLNSVAALQRTTYFIAIYEASELYIFLKQTKKQTLLKQDERALIYSSLRSCTHTHKLHSDTLQRKAKNISTFSAQLRDFNVWVRGTLLGDFKATVCRSVNKTKQNKTKKDLERCR